MRKSLWILLAALVAAVGAPVAHADSVIFTATGSVADGSQISGTVTINTTLGVITAADVIIGPPEITEHTNVVAQGQGYYAVNEYGAVIRNASNTVDFNFSMPDGGSLVGFAGGSCDQNFCGLFDLVKNIGFDNPTTFTLTPVPEPGTLALMLSGLGFVGLMLVTRKRLGLGHRSAT